MKVLHTSDWHIGHRLHEHSQFEEQTLYFEWLVNTIITHKIDVLLVSGDVFDSANPSSQSKKMYYDALLQINNTVCKHIIITGGNHDSPGMLAAPKELLSALAIQVVAKATKEVKDEVFEFEIDKEHLIVAAVPFLRDQDIRRAVANEDFDEITEKYKFALKNHYNAVASHCHALKKENSIVIAMGHLFAVDAQTSESEKDIYIGNLGHINASDFSDVFDYVALGHLHRAQIVGNNAHIRYCGSPLVYSFSEVLNDKMSILLHIENGKIKAIEELEIPRFRLIKSYKGDVDHCINKIKIFQNNKYKLRPWIEIKLDEKENIGLHNSTINAVAAEHNIDVLKISLQLQKKETNIDELLANAKNIKQLKPIDVFKMKCDERNINLEENDELVDAFYEVLRIAEKM